MKTPPNKQKEMGAASLKRMAKECRRIPRTHPQAFALAQSWRELAKIMDAEARLLRSMR